MQAYTERSRLPFHLHFRVLASNWNRRQQSWSLLSLTRLPEFERPTSRDSAQPQARILVIDYAQRASHNRLEGRIVKFLDQNSRLRCLQPRRGLLIPQDLIPIALAPPAGFGRRSRTEFGLGKRRSGEPPGAG